MELYTHIKSNIHFIKKIQVIAINNNITTKNNNYTSIIYSIKYINISIFYMYIY